MNLLEPGQSVIIVTGGSRGIGANIVTTLHGQGHPILFTHSSPDSDGPALADSLSTHGPACVSLRIDVRQNDAPARIFDAAQSLGTVTGLVNNAGITGPLGMLRDLSDTDLQHILELNLQAPIRLCREAARRWQGRSHRSTIVNISSIAARLGAPHEYVAYAASKGGLESFSTGLAKELATDKIHVNVVAPGTILTSIHARAGEPGRPERVSARIPLQRPGQTQEVAQAVAWLLSEQASYVTGSVLTISGGL